MPDALVPSLAALAHEVRLAWCGDTVEIEGILSAKTGGCPEDCHFCAQSSRFDTPVLATPFLDTDQVLEAARQTAAVGASEFCIVLAVRGPDERTMRRLLDLVPVVQAGHRAQRGGIGRASSTGPRPSASPPVECIATTTTSRRPGPFSPRSSRPTPGTSDFRRACWSSEAGMELCCGVLLGMGETTAQRLELIGQLAELAPAEVPVNFLDPRPGTPLAIRKPVRPLEAIRWIAMFRLGLPDVILRYAGGRELTLGELQAMGMTAGINALIVGNYLTTLGRSPDADLTMLRDLRMPIGAISKVI